MAAGQVIATGRGAPALFCIKYQKILFMQGRLITVIIRLGRRLFLHIASMLCIWRPDRCLRYNSAMVTMTETVSLYMIWLFSEQKNWQVGDVGQI